jgi:hypothetical protein
MTQLGAFLVHEGQLSEHTREYSAETRLCLREPSAKEKLTAWWETRCNPLLKGPLWQFTLGKSPGNIFEYDHRAGVWATR